MEEESADDEELQCPVCLLVFQDPRALACGHAFCLSCLRALVESQRARHLEAVCPLCRASIKLDGTVDTLPVSQGLAARVAKFAK